MSRLGPAAVAELDQYAAHWEEILDDAIDYVRQDLAEFDSETDRVLAVFDTAELIERNSPELITKLLVTALVRLARQSTEGCKRCGATYLREEAMTEPEHTEETSGAAAEEEASAEAEQAASSEPE